MHKTLYEYVYEAYSVYEVYSFIVFNTLKVRYIMIEADELEDIE